MNIFLAHLSRTWIRYVLLALFLIIGYIIYLNFGAIEVQEVKEATASEEVKDEPTEEDNELSWFSIIMTIIFLWYVVIPFAVFLVLYPVGFFGSRALGNTPFKIVNDEIVENHFGFFTTLQPGQIKIIERGYGGRFIRCITRIGEHTFKGYAIEWAMKNDVKKPNSNEKWKSSDLPPDNTDEYWEIVKCSYYRSEDGSVPPDAHPIPYPKFHKGFYDLIFGWYRYLWWKWKFFVYTKTGYVFTGIPPFQTVWIYRINYYIKKATIEGIHRTFELELKRNFSDHYRGQESTVYIPAYSMDTDDKVPVDIIIGLQMRITNARKAAYNTDSSSWTGVLQTLIPSRVNDYCRALPLEHVIGGRDRGIILLVEKLGGSEEVVEKKIETVVEDDHDLIYAQSVINEATNIFSDYGVFIKEASTPSRSVVDISSLNPTQRTLAENAIARVERDALKTRTDGQVYAITEKARAVNINDAGRLIAQIDGNVRVVEAGDKASTIISLNTSGDNRNSGDDEEVKSLLRALVLKADKNKQDQNEGE